MRRLLRNLQQQPRSTRDAIALAIAAVFAGTVFIVWLYNMPSRHAALDMRNSQTEADSPGFSQLFDGVREQFSNTKEEVVSAIASTSGNNDQESLESIVDSYKIEVSASSSNIEEFGFSSTTSFNPYQTNGREVKIATTSEVSQSASSSQ